MSLGAKGIKSLIFGSLFGVLVAFQNCSRVEVNDKASTSSGPVIPGMQQGTVTTLCPPGSQTVCRDSTGAGFLTCADDGQSYGTCIFTTCGTNYHTENGRCVANLCVGGAQADCQDETGRGHKVCNSNGQGYGTCDFSICNDGYHLSGTSCVANLCTAGQSSSCEDETGTGTHVCNADGQSYGECNLTVCKPNYELSGNKCVPLPVFPVNYTFTKLRIEFGVTNSWGSWRDVEVFNENGRKVTASGITANGAYRPPEEMLDGNPYTAWGSGYHGGSVTVTYPESKVHKIRLQTSNTPTPCNCTAQIKISLDDINYTTVCTIRNWTDAIWLEFPRDCQ